MTEQQKLRDRINKARATREANRKAFKLSQSDKAEQRTSKPNEGSGQEEISQNSANKKSDNLEETISNGSNKSQSLEEATQEETKEKKEYQASKRRRKRVSSSSEEYYVRK